MCCIIHICLQGLGFEAFKEIQLEAIYVNQKLRRDCILATATGGGKTVPIIMASLLSKKLVVVVCPLKALMEEQIEKLKKMQIGSELTMAGDFDDVKK